MIDQKNINQKTMKANKVLSINVMLLLLTSFNFVLAQTNTLTPVQKNGKWGFADHKGNIVIACKYQQVNFFKNGLAIVCDNCLTVHPHGEDVATSYSDCKQGVIDTKGNLIIPIEYRNIGDFNENGIVKAYRNDGESVKVGYLDKTGKVIMPFIYTENTFFRIGGFSLISLDKKVGLLSKEGKIVIPVCYDEIKATDSYYYHSDIPSWAVIQIRLGDKWGFYNTINHMLVEPQFDVFLHPQFQIKEDETEQFLMTKTGNEIWLWNKATGKKIFIGKYDDVRSLKIDNLLECFNTYNK